ncbi:hypothetical protein [Pedobacter sp. JY14-1]|nr:hypothetical protein [Pedobacter sp. JY14-1]
MLNLTGDQLSAMMIASTIVCGIPVRKDCDNFKNNVFIVNVN